ncbi:hypothetical protein ACLOAU_24315 [Niabella sp. CJ426]|uniref:hypothetical protein n=1 Tax=Niabella sp. CJ426 TaxID=3393740 RepID=UPI003D07B4D4
MFKLFYNIFFGLFLVTLISCKKEEVFSITNHEPEIPVTVLNQKENFVVPTVTGSKAAGTFTIELGIPANSGRTIKEISRVVYTSSATGAANLLKVGTFTNTAASGIYVSTPIAGNGTKATFSSSFDEFKVKTLQTAVATAVPEPTANSALINRFFHFMITLDDGTKIIPMGVRVLVVP